jgi:hypothetical protein
MSEERVDSHPSYALLQFSRVSGSSRHLFGTSIEHFNTVRLRIIAAVCKRDLYHSWYHETSPEYIEVEMSQSQFAEAITSMNLGDGVPCTITYLAGNRVPNPPENEKPREVIREEFKEKMKSVSKKFDGGISEIAELLKKKSLGKADREEILEVLSQLQMELGCNIPFIHRSFDEATDQTVVEAKGEVEAFIMTNVVNAGLSALTSKNVIKTPSLDAGDNPD